MRISMLDGNAAKVIDDCPVLIGVLLVHHIPRRVRDGELGWILKDWWWWAEGHLLENSGRLAVSFLSVPVQIIYCGVLPVCQR